jgi:hypothetical protein
MIYRGTWTARVSQEFEVEADSIEEARSILNDEMSPRNVVELLDFEDDLGDPDD